MQWLTHGNPVLMLGSITVRQWSELREVGNTAAMTMVSSLMVATERHKNVDTTFPCLASIHNMT